MKHPALPLSYRPLVKFGGPGGIRTRVLAIKSRCSSIGIRHGFYKKVSFFTFKRH